MKTYALTVEYDGTAFSGWQFQTNGRTVQGEIESALKKVTQVEGRIMGSGRTDAGVHAFGQVCHVRLLKAMDENALRKALNALLPKDIAVLEVWERTNAFDARKCSKDKTYEYRFYRSDIRRPLLEPYALRLPMALDVEAMQTASLAFAGQHDFAAYQATGSTATNTVRTIHHVSWREEGPYLCFEVSGDGFLYHMVRNMVGVLLAIGRGKLCRADIEKSFEHGNRGHLPPTAKPQGLYLKKVAYSEEMIDRSDTLV